MTGTEVAVEFSLFYFAEDSSDSAGKGRYDLLVEGARFADQHGFAAVWTPERHFHRFGGLYPNPSVTAAALATVTSRVGLRAGSVVVPLHDPLRVVEEWSVVDNLSHGRVGISFASGWHAVDFVLQPDSYRDRRRLLRERVEVVRRLWRGEPVTRTDGTGVTQTVRAYPPPVTPELPVWVTSSGNVETFQLAGELGANLLTHLLGQTVANLGRKIDAYRSARRAAGHTTGGQVTLMLHTFLGPDFEAVRQTVREPLRGYLRSSFDLLARSTGWFGPDLELAELKPSEVDILVDHAFDRYVETSGLFGDPPRAQAMVGALRQAGVDEVACLIDFGVPAEQVLASLEPLAELRRSQR